MQYNTPSLLPDYTVPRAVFLGRPVLFTDCVNTCLYLCLLVISSVSFSGMLLVNYGATFVELVLIMGMK